MIDDADKDLKRWADWVLEPSPGLNLGYGTNILQRIKEGKGQIMPSAPNRVVVVRVDLVALGVEDWVKVLTRSERYVVKLWYLSSTMTAEEKARRLKISRRQLYNRIESLQKKYQTFMASRKEHRNEE